MGDLKILLVEDESIEAMDIKRTLESFGYQVPYVASSGQEAIDKAAQLKPDIILMDIILKGDIDGIEAISKIKELDIPCIYLTAHSEESTIERAKLTEPAGYIIKPYDPTELKYAIELAVYKNMMGKKLKESEKKFHMLFENSPIPYQSLDENGFLLEVNSAWLDCLGYSREEVIGRNFAEFLEPRCEKHFKKNFPLFKAAGEIHDVQFELKRKDGSFIFVSYEGKIGYNELGQFQQTHCMFQDITESQRTEKALLDSEKRLKMGMEIANLAYWEYDVKSDLFTFDDQFYALYGTSAQEMGGDQMSSGEYAQRFLPPEESSIVAEEISKALETDDPDYSSKVQHSIIRADGEKKFMLIRYIIVKDENGQTIKIIGVNQDITELKLAEEDLAISERRYRAVFENSGTALLTFKNDGTILMINSEWERVSGYSREEVECKMKWMDLVHPDYREMMIKFHDQRLKKPDSVPGKYEAAFINKNGVKLIMYVSVVELPGTDRWLASALDITDLKKTQKSLERNVLRFRALAENAIDGIITTDIQGNILYFNHSLMDIFGYKQEELESSQLTKLMPERYRKKFLEGLKKFRTTGEHHLAGRTIETIGLKKDGTEFSFEMSLTMWEIDEEVYFTSIIRDITDRKEMEKSLKDSEKKYRTLFELDPNYTILLTLDGHLVDFNQAAMDITGLTKEELLGKHFMELEIFPEEELQLNIKRFSNFSKGEEISPFESRIYDANGEIRFIEIKQTFIKLDDKIKYILLICSDITHRKKAKDEIIASLKEKEVLLQEIHHRVKNNMQIISSLLNLQKQYVKEEEALNVLTDSQNRVKSMAMIHEKLYQSDNLTDLKFSEYIPRLVSDLLYSFDIPADQVKVVTNVEDVKLNIETAVPCGLIINELVSNSFKHAYPQGRTGKLEVSLKKYHDHYELAVGDDGIGFPDELDFKNTKTLGLRLVNNLVDQLDGEIGLDSSHGTEFKINFKELVYQKRV